MKSGIYKIVCLADDKSYIGSTANLIKRKNYHFNHLIKNDHDNQHLQNAYNKYGLRNFEFHVIEYCDVEKLIEKEQYYIDTLKPKFNIAPKAKNCLGVKWSVESKIKQSLMRIGKKFSEESKAKMSVSALNKPKISIEKMKQTKRSKSIFNKNEIIKMRMFYESDGLRIIDISKMFGGYYDVIKAILYYKNWSDV